VGPRAGLDGRKTRPHRDLIPDRPVRSQSLYRLSCRVHAAKNIKIIKKVKCALVQSLRLCTGRTAHTGSRGIALLFLDHGTRRGDGSAPRPGRLYPGKEPVPISRPQHQSGRAENLVPTAIRFWSVQPVVSRYTD